MKSIFLAGLLMALIAVGCGGSKEAESGVATMTPSEAMTILGRDSAYVFLDVRTRAEFASETGHLRGALLVPVDSLQARLSELMPYRSRTIVTYCRTGPRSVRAEKFLLQHGFRSVSIAGGITRWNKENLPVVKEQP